MADKPRAKPLSRNRREYLKSTAGATLVGTFGAGCIGHQATERTSPDSDATGDVGDNSEATRVEVSEGTNIAVTASPDGESLVMDLQGLLFSLPREGGDAEKLTDVELEPARPDYAPDGSRIAFQGYADGNFDIWTMSSDGGDVRQLTDGFYDDREPRWSPDGTRIAFSSDRGENYDIWTVDVESGELRQWTDDDRENFEPAWSPDGSEIAYVTDGAIEAVDRTGETRTLVSADSNESLNSPSWSPSGERLAYIRREEREGKADEVDLMISGEEVTDGEDVFAFTPNWLSEDRLLYTADGGIRVLDTDSRATSEIPFTATLRSPSIAYDTKTYDFDGRGAREVQGIMTPTLSPDGERVAFVALNDLWVMSIGRSPRRVTDDAFFQTDPAWSPDGRYLAYSSDRAGTQDLYVYDLREDTHYRVTESDDAALSASWSPDGSEIAFQNQDGATFTVELSISKKGVETGEIRRIRGPEFAPSTPTWSADGTTLAMTVLTQYSNRFREGTSQILTVDLETGEENRYSPVGEFGSISTRDADGPVWSPDGRRMAFVVDSTLYVRPVTETGEPDGPAERITDEVTDAPSWSGDSEWLLYLNNGRLKKVRRDGSETREIHCPLEYQQAQPSGRTVIYAGRLWDGTSPEVHENVTIEVVNNRIESVTPDTSPPNGKYVDASDLTVIPGLWDCHVHQTFNMGALGDRQGRINLAYGVTSTVSRGELVYRAIEQREALRSGNRVGPRFFASGELIDGSRIYYNSMRPTTSVEQVRLEMTRAIELDYDFVKTYVRLTADLMDEVTEIAHEELGVPAGSHYLSPGSFVGQDGTTHLSATQRLGFPRTESATNRTYDDVIRLYGEGERWMVTTVFDSSFLLSDELEDDPRTELFPSWVRLPRGSDEFPSDPDCESRLCRNANTFKEILDGSGKVLTGTDAPLDNHGLGVHGNLRPLVYYGGFSPHEALLTATRFPAEHQGVADDLGTLESGKLADMVFVDGNPLDRIEDAMNVEMTMKNGELFSIDELTEPFV